MNANLIAALKMAAVGIPVFPMRVFKNGAGKWTKKPAIKGTLHQLWSGAHTAKELDPREMFEHVARALCPGQSWPAAIADLMQVRLDTIRHWRTGRSQLRPDHFATMLNLINDKRVELGKVERELREWLARQPSKDSKDE